MPKIKMVKIEIGKDERYPDYSFREFDGQKEDCIIVHPSTIARWNKAIKEYEKVQREMEVKYDR